MIQSLNRRPKPFFRFLNFNPKWISTSTSKTPFLTLFAGKPNRENPDHDHDHDYELALVSALKHCASNSAVAQGQQIHSHVLKSGLNNNTFVHNSIISMYAKSGLIKDAESIFRSSEKLDPVSCNIMVAGYVKSNRIEDARKLFEKMPGKGCVSYTTMIMGFTQNNRWNEGIEVFKDMRNAGVDPNELTLSTVISACSHSGGIWECRMLHGLSVKLQVDALVLISTNLIHMYCVCSSLQEAKKLFDQMPEPNTVSWNVILNGYVKAGPPELIDTARALFDRIPVKDVVSWGTMIDGYVQTERLHDALILYRDMMNNGVPPNDVMIVDLISACGRERVSAVREGMQLHGTAVKTGYECYNFIQTTIIHFYSVCGRIESARLQFETGVKTHIPSSNALLAGLIRNGRVEDATVFFDAMSEKDVFSWSSMISGYARTGQPSKALGLFRNMIETGLKPNQITMASVFSAISALGSLSEGRSAHEYVTNNAIALNDNLSAAIIDMYGKCGSISSGLDLFYRIRDNVVSVSPWNAIICGLAVHGYANLSLEIFSELEKRDIELNSVTFIGVLNACSHAGLVEVGEMYFRSMESVYNVVPDIKHYGCLVDVLGRAGEVEKAEEVIKSMPMEADVVVWGALLAACRTHGNLVVGERAARCLERIEPCHGGGKVLLSNIYADAGRWDDVVLVREEMGDGRVDRSFGYSGVV